MLTNKRTNSGTEGNMDEKEIGFSIAKWLSANGNALYASMIAAAVAFLRIAYEYSTGRSTRTWLATFTEAFLCGVITLAISSGLELFGIPTGAATMVGGGIGWFGVEKMREVGNSWLDKKVKDDKQG